MGVIRFQVYPPDRILPETVPRVYFAAPDRSLWQCRATLSDGILSLERFSSDSGYFHIPWHLAGRCEVTLSTGWLMERRQPYHLQVELARGKLNQVRNQLAEWEAIGLQVPPALRARLKEAMELFDEAVTGPDDPGVSAQLAEKAIVAALEAADALGTAYVEQALAMRLRQQTRLETHLGVDLGDSEPMSSQAALILGAFNCACVPFNWRCVEAVEHIYDWSTSDAQLEWCRNHGLAAMGGPLIRFDDPKLPDWLCLWEGNFDSLLGCIGDYAEAVVKRYRTKFQLWRCGAGLSLGEGLSLSPEDRLRIAMRVVEIARSHDLYTPRILCFEQPWGEYMSRDDRDPPPLYLADSLIRAGLGVEGVGLEINLGYYPRGTYPRDLLAFSQLLDDWSLLGIPLYLFLTVPSASAADPLARVSTRTLSSAFASGATPRNQARWIEQFLPMLLAKPAVRGVIWNQLRDSEPHLFPHGGLFDEHDQPKPALKTLSAWRAKYLR